MRTLISALCFTGLAIPLSAQGPHLDRSQGDSALRLMRAGETVRFYCKQCSDVVYTSLVIESLEVEPVGLSYRLVLNGEQLDVTRAYFDSGFDDGWENLSELLGFALDSQAPKLPPALDEDSRLAAHTGVYTGTIGKTQVRMELVLDVRRFSGTYAPTAGGPSVRVLATSYNATRKSETLALVERSEQDRLVAILQGDLDAETATFTGTRTPLDGAPAEPFELTRSDAGVEDGR